MEAFHVSKVPYLDVEDTIAEVGITRRQLNHWEAQGLIRAHLGAGSNKYTVDDIQRLKALKHLIVDRKLPFAFVKELVSSGIEHSVKLSGFLVETAALFDASMPSLSDHAFDFAEKRLAKKSQIANEWWCRSFATAKEDQIADSLSDLAVLLFRVIRSQQDRPAAFEERAAEIFDRIRRLSEIARVQVRPWGPVHDLTDSMSPKLSNDSYMDADALRYEFLEHASRLAKFRDALPEWARLSNSPYLDRFWDDDAIERVKGGESESLNDVPF